MRKKLKVLCLLCCLFVIINSTFCYADDNVKSGYYKFRNYNSNMYMSNSSGKLVQKTFPSYLEPSSFLVANTKGYNNIYKCSYTIHPKDTSLNVMPDTQLATKAIVCAGSDINRELWQFIYANNGAFKIYYPRLARYMAINNSYINKNGVQIDVTEDETNYKNLWYIEKDISDGIYRLKNKETGKYLTINNYTNQLSLTAKSATSVNQQFKIASYSDGYSDIIPLSRDEYSISVAGWDMGLDNENASIRLEVGQSSEGQMWKFLVNKNGSLRIMSQLSNASKAITVINNSICSSTYVDTNSYNEWELEEVPVNEISSQYVTNSKKNKVFVSGFKRQGDSTDRRSCVDFEKSCYEAQNSANIVKSMKASNGYDEILKALKENEIFSIETHGDIDCIAVYNEDGSEQTKLNISVIDNLKQNELAGLKICLLSACHSASNVIKDSENKPINMAYSIYKKGAKCVIGFKDKIYAPMSIDWNMCFNEMISKGANVNLALSYADWYTMKQHSWTGSMDNRNVYGNSNIVYQN